MFQGHFKAKLIECNEKTRLLSFLGASPGTEPDLFIPFFLISFLSVPLRMKLVPISSTETPHTLGQFLTTWGMENWCWTRTWQRKVMSLSWRVASTRPHTLSRCGCFDKTSPTIKGFDSWFNIAGVLEEAEFYNITSLIKLIKDKIRERDCKTSQVRDVPWHCLSYSGLSDVPKRRSRVLIHVFRSTGPSKARVPCAAVPGGRVDADGVHHVWRLEVWAGKSPAAAPRQRSTFLVLHPPD